MIQKHIPRNFIEYVSVGHGAGTFNLALDEALQLADDETVYFIENGVKNHCLDHQVNMNI